MYRLTTTSGHTPTRISACLLMILMLLIGNTTLVCQNDEVRGGTRYMVAFFPNSPGQSEKPLPQPMWVLVSAETDATIRVTTPSTIGKVADIDRQFDVEAEKTLVILIPMPYMPDTSGVAGDFGVQIISDEPINVKTLMQWQGNGEMTAHAPVHAWGTSYHTANTFVDGFGRDAESRTYHPSCVTLIAADDDTEITIKTALPMVEGGDLEKQEEGTYTVTLNKGDVMPVDWEIDESEMQEWSSDPSGTLITGTKPFAVLSGARKNAIMRMPDVLPPTGPFRASAHFVRNNIHESLLPDKVGGTEFITVPFIYTAARVTGIEHGFDGIDDDRGDVIRIIGLEDQTKVEVYDEGLETWVAFAFLDAGETAIDTASTEIRRWRSDKPIHLYQYGKSYAKVLPPGHVEDGKGERAMGHPTVEAGMPMLTSVPSLDRMISKGIFFAPEGMDNFLNLIFESDDVDSIWVDKIPVSSRDNWEVIKIEGTKYSYVQTPIGVGSHDVRADVGGSPWLGWTYGSLDGLQMGRAYSTPIGVSYSTPCDVEYAYEGTNDCGNIVGLVKAIAEDSACASIISVNVLSIRNYEFDISPDFTPGDDTVAITLTVVDPDQSATAEITFESPGGAHYKRRFFDIPSGCRVHPIIDHFKQTSRPDT